MLESWRMGKKITAAVHTTDGAGVRLRRSIGAPAEIEFLDPFILFHEFSSRNLGDYAPGFPFHPHAGVEAVTYMTDGVMNHQDGRGVSGTLGPGDLLWISAGRGMGHGEMPGNGTVHRPGALMRGFQLWINQPAAEKESDPQYRSFRAAEIPRLTAPGGAQIRVLAGEAAGLQGPAPILKGRPFYLDIALPPRARWHPLIPPLHAAFVYTYEGAVYLNEQGPPVVAGQMAVLEFGLGLALCGGPAGARLLLAAAAPLGETIYRHIGFVMNSPQRLWAAVQAYRDAFPQLTGPERFPHPARSTNPIPPP